MDCSKYLGLIRHKHLNYTEYLEGIVPKIYRKIWLLSKIMYYMTESIAIKVSKYMIAPYSDYVDMIFMGESNAFLDKLQMLQNRVLNILKSYII